MKSVTIFLCFVALSNGFQYKDLHSSGGRAAGTSTKASNSNMDDNLGFNKPNPAGEDNTEFWLKLAREELAQRVQKSFNTNQAKNVIFFLGDGMSLTTVTAARIRKGQLKGNPGEEDHLSFEQFPYAGLSRTYCANAQVPDSACTSTAYLCGVKANIVTLGVNAKVNYNNCTESMDTANHVSSIAAWAQKAGKATGFITTTTLTHASPAGGYAHAANRFWESDTDITTWSGQTDTSNCMDIAQQLVTQETGKNFNIMLGGGMGKFLPKTLKDAHGKMGERSDGKNLLSTWQAMHQKGVLVVDRSGLMGVDPQKVDNILGLFQSGVMDFHVMANNTKQPTLEEMTEVAIRFLSQKSEKGYFIFIEGGLIDYGNHATIPGISIDETLELDKAVQKARDMTNPNDTLIVVSSDHAHPLSIAGYPGRGTNILGLNQHDVDINGVRYATLNYATGTKQYLDAQGNRLDLESIIEHDPLAVHPSYIATDQGVHAGDDVGIFASGPHEHLFRGVLQQNSLPHLMAYAACIGDGPTVCNRKPQ